MALKEILNAERYSNVVYISDPRFAVKTYQEFHPDLILLDLNMPHMSGFDVMEALKPVAKDSYLSILVLTGETDPEARIKALNSGAKDFLNKPFTITETLARIRNLLEVRLLHNDMRDQTAILENQVQARTRQLREALADLEDSNHRIKEAYIDTIYRLTLASEYKDEDTTEHIRRMSQYSAFIGQELGWKQQELDLLFYSSPMHDIGKIGIPDKILLKQGPLDKEEWEIMKSHTLIGAKILSGSHAPILKMAESIALHHHENWDGTGYPNGKKGDQTPLEGRIVKLVDTYDALRSKRPYKTAFSHEKAMQIILEGDHRTKPEHYDPSLLAILRKHHQELDRIFTANSIEQS